MQCGWACGPCHTKGSETTLPSLFDQRVSAAVHAIKTARDVCFPGKNAWEEWKFSIARVRMCNSNVDAKLLI